MHRVTHNTGRLAYKKLSQPPKWRIKVRDILKRARKRAKKEQEKRWAVEFGLCLKRLRKERKLTQKEVTTASGLSQGTISRLERGIVLPDLYSMMKLDQFFDGELADIFYARIAYQEQKKARLPDEAGPRHSRNKVGS